MARPDGHPSKQHAPDLERPQRAGRGRRAQVAGLATVAAVHLLPGIAHATFVHEPGSPYDLGTDPYGVVAADFDRNGRPDVAVINGSSSTVTVFLRTAAGGFVEEAGSPISVGPGPNFGAVADFDSDGLLDLAVANYAPPDGVTVLRRKPAGGFESLGHYSAPRAGAVAAADFDGVDGPDLAVTNYNSTGSDGFTTLLQRRTGGTTFAAEGGTKPATGVNPRYVAAADFNADGRPDLAITNFTDSPGTPGSVSVLLRKASGGGFVAEGPRIPVGQGPFSVVAADFDRDGRIDLALTNYRSHTVTVLLRKSSNDGFAQEGSAISVGANPTGIAAADFNNDLRPDVAVANGGSGNVTILLRNAAGGFRADPSSPVTSANGPYDVAAADFNSDGRMDLAVTNASRKLVILANTSDVTPPETTITAGPSGPVKTTTPAFEFASSEPGSTFECSIDGGAATPCSSPYTPAPLGEGAHTFRVAATDPSLNPDPSPAVASFAVDTTPPRTSITSGPMGDSEDASPTFQFTSNEAGSTFACSLDGGSATPCSSPFTTPSLARGTHSFKVTAIDAAGNADPAPPVRSFTVVAPRLPAQTKLTAAPYARFTIVRILRIAKLAGGETILLRCRGKGCPFKSKRLKAKRAGTLKLDKLVRRARLRRGVKLEVTITKLETVGRVTIVAIRRNKAPRISRLCLPPGATKPAKCA